jgi:hypothetical protein
MVSAAPCSTFHSAIVSSLADLHTNVCLLAGVSEKQLPALPARYLRHGLLIVRAGTLVAEQQLGCSILRSGGRSDAVSNTWR